MAVHPGEILKDELEERGISQKELADRMGVQRSHLNELIKGTRNMTMAMAGKLEQVLGISSVLWMNLQTQYDYDVVVLEKKDKEEKDAAVAESKLLAVVNLKELYKRFTISASTCKKRLDKLFSRLSIGLEDISKIGTGIQGYFQRSGKLQMDDRNMRTWLMLAMTAANEASVTAPYKEGNAFQAACDIASMANSGKITVKRIRDCLNGYGIAYAVVEKLDKTPIDAFSTMAEGKPAIVVTYRHNDMDKLSFDILHELCHIERHISKGYDSFISIESDRLADPLEEEANSFARDMLIPPTLWNEILAAHSKSLDPNLVVTTIARVAALHGISKTIAVARYKHDSNYYTVKKYRSPKIALD